MMMVKKCQSGIIGVLVVLISIFVESSAEQSQLNTASSAGDIVKSSNDDRQYEAITLTNGMQVVLVSDPSLEVSAASLVVGVGSAQDPNEQLGLAHYLEHMLFLGTKKYPEPNGFMKYVQANGGMTNAFTAFTRTNYLFQINSTKFDEALDKFSDYFKNPTFDSEYSDKERAAVNNEWSMRKGQDNDNIFRLHGLTANPKHPSARFSIGNLESLSDKENSILIDEMKEFYQRYYSANIMKLTLVGKQSLPELRVLAEKHFSSIANKKIELPEIKTKGITKKEMAMEIHYKPLKDLKAVFVDFPIASNKHQWQFKANEYLYYLLTSEDKGTLGEQLRSKGWINKLSAIVQSDFYGEDGFCRVFAELTDSGLQHQDEVVAAIFAYVDMIKRKGLDEKYYLELQAMRAKDFSNMTKPYPLQQAVGLSMAQFDLPVVNLLNSNSVFAPYNEKIIKNLFKQLEEKKARIWFVNSSKTVDTAISYYDGSYKVKKISSAQFRVWNKLKKQFSFGLPLLNDLFSIKTSSIVKSELFKPRLVVSQSGVEAFLVHSEFYSEDKGTLSLQLNVDFALGSPKEAVSAHLLNDVFSKQLVGLSDRASRASLYLSTSVMDVNSQGVYIGGYTEKHALLVEQALTVFANLSVSDEAFTNALNTYRTNLQNQQKNQVNQRLFADMRRMQYRYQWPNDVLLTAASKIQKTDLITYHQRVKTQSLLRIYAAGNYSHQQIKDIALTAASILPSKILPNERRINEYVIPSKSEVIELQQETELADNGLLQVWFGKEKSDDEQAQLVVLNAMFLNAFFTQLRTNEQLGYAVESFTFPVDDVAGFAMFVQSSTADLSFIKSRVDKFRQNYLPSLEKVAEADVEQIKQSILANVLQKPANFYADVNRYSGEFWHAKYQFDGRDRFVESLKKVKKQDLIAVYKNIILNKESPQFLFQIRGKPFAEKPFAKAE